MRFVKILLFIIILVIVVLFFMQNTDVLSQYLHLEFAAPGAQALDADSLHWYLPVMPLYAVILIAFFLGAVLVWLSSLLVRLRLGSELRRANRKARELEQEVNSLRKLPLQKNGQAPAGQNTPPAVPAGQQGGQQGGQQSSGAFEAAR